MTGLKLSGITKPMLIALVIPLLFVPGSKVIVRVDAGPTPPNPMGPGTGTILIHEYLDTAFEMQAFENGEIDIVDGAVPFVFLDAWGGPVSDPRAIITRGEVAVQKTVDLGMREIDMNSFAWPTSDPALRRAIGYLVDRQRIVIEFAGNRAVPICAPAPPGQPGALGCIQLGYPTEYGEFSPEKSLQVLYEGGWRDSDNDGLLEAPNGIEPTLRFFVRRDDPIRRDAGDQLINQLKSLPNSFTDKTGGGRVIVCGASASCRFDVNDLCPRIGIVCAPIVLRGPPWDDWNLYTGGWGLGFDPDQSFFLYSSGFAPTGCGGGWPGSFPLNYPCYVDSEFDRIAEGQVTGRTYADIVASAQASYRYGWGYDRAAGKINGTMPSVPLYSLVEETVAWKTDQGIGAVSNPDGTRACWTGLVGQELGQGLANTATLTGLHLNNCQNAVGYNHYRGEGVLDWGFSNQIDFLNPFSQWLWDYFALSLTYGSCLESNPVNLGETIPPLCESFGDSTYFNQMLGGVEAAVAVYKFRDGVRWSDGRFLTAIDFKFSIEYSICGFNICGVPIFDSDADRSNGIDGIRVEGADPTNGIGGRALVFFDRMGATLARNIGSQELIPKHVWCNSWPDTAADCAYPIASNFPGFDLTKHVGTGPYIPVECTGVDCTETITLRPNPYYEEGTRYWNLAARVSLQPDLNRDDRIDQFDLDLLAGVDPDDQRFDVDYRIVDKETVTITNPFGPGSVAVTLRGPRIDATDRSIIERLVFEGQNQGTPIVWPPSRSLTYVWPDVDRDNDVDLDDVIGVYLYQFRPVTPVSALSIRDVDYDMDVDLDDLIITFIRQFTKPVGVA
jgi:ABC-type transport system substrate-binding protein